MDCSRRLDRLVKTKVDEAAVFASSKDVPSHIQKRTHTLDKLHRKLVWSVLSWVGWDGKYIIDEVNNFIQRNLLQTVVLIQPFKEAAYSFIIGV